MVENRRVLGIAAVVKGREISLSIMERLNLVKVNDVHSWLLVYAQLCIL